MIEEIAKDLYRIPVPLPGNPLKELNSYFIRGGERDLLVDTGFRKAECLDALQAGLRRLGSQPARRDVLITHLHTDHAGTADLAVGPRGRIYVNHAELSYSRRNRAENLDGEMLRRFESEGFDRAHMRRLFAAESDNMKMPGFGSRLVVLQARQCLTYGDYRLETIPVPGHTPGNMMLWAEKQGIMFCGDHILFDVSPNITPYAGVEDSLGNYLDSLREAANYPVRLALPGHRKSGDYQARIAQLLAHHARRLDQVRRIVQETPGLCACEIAQRMPWNIRAESWEDFPVAQQWFAMGECMAHLDHIRAAGQITRELRKDRCRYFPG